MPFIPTHPMINKYSIRNVVIEESKRAKRRVKGIPKKFEYYCPRCLYQTNKKLKICPKCGRAKLQKTKPFYDDVKSKWFRFFCARCLYQTNKYTKHCPQCKTGRLENTKFGERYSKRIPLKLKFTV